MKKMLEKHQFKLKNIIKHHFNVVHAVHPLATCEALIALPKDL